MPEQVLAGVFSLLIQSGEIQKDRDHSHGLDQFLIRPDRQILLR